MSRDLIHWETLPMALERGAEGEQDYGECMTGWVMDNQGTFHIIYSGRNFKPQPNKGFVEAMHATSKDPVHFTKHPEETWGADGADYQTNHKENFKDPCIVRNEKEKKWWMFFSGQALQVKGPACALAVSGDLIHWKQVPLIVGLPTGDCTDIFQIGSWWYRITNVEAWRAKEPAGPRERLADFDTPHLVVPRRMFDGKRHVLLGGIRDLVGWRDPKQNWPHVVCLPRETYADAAGQLLSRPVPEVTAFFNQPVASLSNGARPSVIDPVLRPWEKEHGPSWLEEKGVLTGCLRLPYERARCRFDAPTNYMLRAGFRLSPGATLTIGFRDQGQGGAGAYRLAISPRNQEIELVTPSENFTRKCPLDAAKPITVQAFVQGPMIECWGNDAYAFSFRAYDYPEGKLGLEAVGGRFTLTDLTISAPKEGNQYA